MRKIAFLALFALSGCGDFTAGDMVQAYVQRDQNNPCRVIIMPGTNGEKIPSMTAMIEGCRHD